jgi:2-polyprenyl-3-methyl-5-hydroxy-6-metoxy-1,4-benzoquinol methylase
MDIINQRAELQNQERTENDARYINEDVRVPLPIVLLHSKDQKLWDRYVGPLAGQQVLDIGCGSGLTAVWLASKGATVFAVDISPEGVAKTLERARFHGLQDRVRVYCANACQLETVITPNSIDIALGFSVCIICHHKNLGRA